VTSAAIRLYIASATLALILLAAGRRPKLDWRARGFLPVAIALAVNFVFFHVGLNYTSATSPMLLENTAPILVVAILFAVFHERVAPIEIVATVVVVLGVYLTVHTDFTFGGAFIKGDVLEILAGATWAAFIVAAGRSTNADQSPFDRINFMLGAFLLAALMMTPLAAVNLPHQITAVDVVLLIVLGIFPTAIAYALWYEAAAHTSTVVASLMFAMTVIFTFANAATFLGEKITTAMVAGSVLIVAGVILAKLKPTDPSAVRR
jgi:drug/metabolite transporter (DMT)-like permease